jgi:hypothetical protein
MPPYVAPGSDAFGAAFKALSSPGSIKVVVDVTTVGPGAATSLVAARTAAG